jgi:HD-GYP domain-containing protein (c-di-GMP phosphodiesterase class II)
VFAGIRRAARNEGFAMLAEVSRALEERDQTYGHGARVAALAEPVAERLGWDRERIASLRFGAPLHDIGKVTVRPEVLGKPGPLTRDELAEIRHHPTAGAALVLPLRRARPALPYVLFHHEHWDGGGYPAGLHGHAIPLEARVLAVADAFDAMTSPRPYRRPLALRRALAEIERCAGTQFDPLVAEVFMEVWTEESVEREAVAAAS